MIDKQLCMSQFLGIPFLKKEIKLGGNKIVYKFLEIPFFKIIKK